LKARWTNIFKMVASINSTSTKADQWQEKCWSWAETNQPFEIRDMEAAHFMFCQEICAEYDYTYQYRCQRSESVAQFKPLD
jgi:hypothetical protein